MRYKGQRISPHFGILRKSHGSAVRIEFFFNIESPGINVSSLFRAIQHPKYFLVAV
jgi:hypothetical protein